MGKPFAGAPAASDYVTRTTVSVPCKLHSIASAASPLLSRRTTYLVVYKSFARNTCPSLNCSRLEFKFLNPCWNILTVCVERINTVRLESFHSLRSYAQLCYARSTSVTALTSISLSHRTEAVALCHIAAHASHIDMCLKHFSSSLSSVYYDFHTLIS